MSSLLDFTFKIIMDLNNERICSVEDWFFGQDYYREMLKLRDEVVEQFDEAIRLNDGTCSTEAYTTKQNYIQLIDQMLEDIP